MVRVLLTLLVGAATAATAQEPYDLTLWYTADFALGAVRRFEGVADLKVRYDGLDRSPGWPLHRVVSLDPRADGLSYQVDPAIGKVIRRRNEQRRSDAFGMDGRELMASKVADMIPPATAMATARRELIARRSAAPLPTSALSFWQPWVTEEGSYANFDTLVNLAILSTVESPFRALDVPDQRTHVTLLSRDGTVVEFYERWIAYKPDWGKALTEAAIRKAALGLYNAAETSYAEVVKAFPMLMFTTQPAEPYRLFWWVTVGFHPAHGRDPQWADGAEIGLDSSQ